MNDYDDDNDRDDDVYEDFLAAHDKLPLKKISNKTWYSLIRIATCAFDVDCQWINVNVSITNAQFKLTQLPYLPYFPVF